MRGGLSGSDPMLAVSVDRIERLLATESKPKRDRLLREIREAIRLSDLDHDRAERELVIEQGRQ